MDASQTTTEIDPESVRHEVDKAYAWQIDMYGIKELVRDMDDTLTEEEKAWASKNLAIKVVIV